MAKGYEKAESGLGTYYRCSATDAGRTCLVDAEFESTIKAHVAAGDHRFPRAVPKAAPAKAKRKE